MKTKHTVLAAAMAAALGCAHAQSIKALDPVVVTASKVEEPQGQATVLVEVISRQAIEESGAANISELLDQVSGGLLTRQYGRLGVDAAFDLGYLGGASAQRTLIMVDGVRLNDIDNATIRWGQLPLDAIEQVEIRKAGGGVLFGDRALGGVVNIITKRAEDSGSAHVTVGGFGTRAIGLHKSARSGDTQLQVSAQQAETNGYRDGAEQKLKSGQFGLKTKTPIGRIGMTHRISNEDVIQPFSIPLDTFNKDPRNKGSSQRSKRQSNNTELLWANLDQSVSSWSASVSKEASKNDAFTRGENNRDTLNLQLGQNVKAGRVILGVEHFDADSISNRSNRLRVEQQSSAIYASVDYPVGMSIFNLGSRVQDMTNTFYRTVSSPTASTKENLKSWSLGGLTLFGDSSVRYSLQSSFAFPSADQLFTYTPGFEPVDIFSGVKAMKSREGQVALSGEFAGLQFETGGRYIEVAGEIGQLLNCVGANSCNTNLYDTSRAIGFVKLRGGASNALSWTASIDRIQSEIKSGTNSGRRVPMVPDLVAKGSLSWKRDQSLYKVVANHRGQMVQSDDDANTRFRIPARLTLDAGYTYAWSSQRRELSLWVRNLTDRQYFDFASFGSVAPADGRSVELRVKQDF